MTSALESLSRTIQELDSAAMLELPLDLVHPDPEQPRQNAQADRQSLEEMAQSFQATRGPLHPLHVEPHPELEGHWQIVAGERRYHATALAGFSTIRAIPLPRLTPEQRVTLQLIENDQRQDLDLLSRARGYERLLKVSKKKAGEVARLLGVSPTAFSNTLRTLRASELAREAIAKKLLTNPETVRLFEALTGERQQRFFANAQRTGEPISRPALERAVQEEKERRFLAENTPEGALQDADPVPSSQAASLSPRGADSTIALPPLALRALQRLFELLGLPFPDDPSQAAAALIAFLESER